MTEILDELTDRLVAFRDARDWRRFHGLKNLMLSLNLEAAELRRRRPTRPSAPGSPRNAPTCSCTCC
jgi:hypothetical protein